MRINQNREVVLFLLMVAGLLCCFVTNGFAKIGLSTNYLKSYGVSLYDQKLNSGLSQAGTADPFLKLTPRGYKRIATIDSTGKNVQISEEINNIPLFVPASYSLEDYWRYSREQHLLYTWQQYKVKHVTDDFDDGRSGGGLAIDIPVKIKSKAFQTIFGGDRVGLSVTGNITINGGFRHEKRSQVRTAINRGSDYNFKMEQTQQFKVTGNVGDKVTVSVDQDSERPFDFENTIKLNYNGYEDEIIKKIEAGNISLSLPATRFVSFSGKNSGLFGLKAQMQMGNLNMTMIASQEKGENKKLTYSGGAQEGTQTIRDYSYMKGIYFFLDNYHRDNYFPLQNGEHYYDYNRSIVDIEVYISTNEQDPKRIWGYAAADSDKIFLDKGEFEISQEHVEGYWARLEKTDYFVENNLGFIKLNNYISDDKMLAVAYRDSIHDFNYGDINFNTLEGDSIIHLKLLKPKNPRPSDKTWDLMFRHIYYLGGRDIEEDGFELKIFYKPPSGDDQETIQTADGVKSYLHVFNLDNVDESGNPVPDNKIDNNNNILRLGAGELEFPSLRPFDDINNKFYDDLKKGDPNKLSDAMYDTTNQTEITRKSRFYIEVNSKSRSSTMQLGWNVIEGSEEVRLNGALLQSGTDYIIDYYSGTLTVLDERATSPSADLEVTYQRNELFQLEKKTLLGMRAEYDLWDDSFIGGTFLYLNQRTLDQKVRVGKGPMRNLIWDLNTKLSFKPNFLTKMADMLPIVQTKQESELKFEGEIAQILPNPNTLNNESTGDKDGVAYIDDFEASKKTTPLGVIQGGWTVGSTPLQKDLTTRGQMYWYNPYEMVRIQEIWPDREVNANTPQTVHVLNMWFSPNESIANPHDSWFGIMRALSSGYADQSDSKFLEIWVQGDGGRLHIDMGQITEDVIPNKKLDTEDKLQNEIRNGLLDPGEDVGLDGMEGNDPNDFWDINNNGVQDAGEPTSNDDWSYNPTSGNYENSNGTEGNENNVNGRIPDTEDINGNGSLDQINNYFEYSFPLDKQDPDAQKYIASNTEYGWYLYRIPLAEPDTVIGAPDMTRLEYARIWVDGFVSPAGVRIAEINLVGNDWKEKGVADSLFATYDENNDSTIIATVINTHDNPEYDPPPGVRGVRDRITRVEAKEQSLVIRINSLPNKQHGILQKTFYQSENYIHYRTMKMYIHGGDDVGENFPPMSEGDSPIRLFLRFGANETNYYEIKKPVYQGWEGNNMEVELSELTNLKFEIPDTTSSGYAVRERFFEDGTEWRVVGDPSLTNVKQLMLGVENTGDEDFSGEIWVNELRLSGVHKDKGYAMRARVDLKLADLFNVNAEVNRKDADFHNINNRFGSGNNQLSYTISSGLQLQKFLPRSWGVSLPVNFNYKSSESTPKYISGSDILVTSSTPDTVLDKIRSQSESVGYGISFRKTTKSNNFFIKNTLDNFSVSFNGAESASSDSRTEKSTLETYSGKVDYRLNFDGNAHIRPFFWMDKIPVIKKLGELKFFYWPTGFNVNASGTQTKSYSLTRSGLENSSRPFSISRSVQTGYRPFANLSVDLSRTHKSDLTQIEKPKEELLKGKFGELTNVSQSANAKFNPKIFQWLTTNFSYNTSYQWSNNLQLKNTGTGRSASNNSSISGNFTFTPEKLITSLFGKSKRKSRSSRNRPRSSGERTDEQEDDEEQKKKKIDILMPFKKTLSGVGYIFKSIEPINISYSQTDNVSYSALQEGTPSLGFMFGFEDSTGLGTVEGVGTNRNSFRNTARLSLGSGFNIGRNVKVTLRFNNDNSRNETTQITGDQSYSSYKISDEEDAIPFPEWTVRWSGIDKLPFIKKYTKRVSFDHSFSGKTSESWQNSENNVTRRTYAANFRPLVGLNISFANDISTQIRYNKGSNYEENIVGGSGGTRILSSDFSLQAKYSRSGGFRFPIPIWPFKNKEFKNDIDLSVTASISDNVNEQKMTGKWEEMNKTSKWSFKPQMQYRFSNNVSGGIHFEYGKNESKRMGTTTFQDFGLNVRIEIRGR